MTKEVNTKKASMSGNDYAEEPVPRDKRVVWVNVTLVWFGAAMVAQLYQGGVTLGTGMGSLSNALAAILCGAAFLALFVCLNGYIGVTTGCNSALSGRYAYGSVGVAIPGFHIADIGWFVVMNAIFANILSQIIPTVDMRVWCILISMLFITNNYIGFHQMVILNKIAFPILLVVGLLGIVKVSMLPGGMAAVFDARYPMTYTMAQGIVMVIGTWISGCSRAADYMRFAKDGKSSFLASVLGFFFGFCLCIICGAIWGAATGTTLIGDTLKALGLVFLGGLMFFVQTWTTAEHSSYVTSTALPTSIQVVTKKKVPRRSIVAAIGLLGVCVTGLNIQNYYVPFISFLGFLIPVIGAIVIADFYIMARTRYHWTGHKNYYRLQVNCEDVMHHKFNWAVIPSLCAGLLLGWKTTIGVPSITAFIGTIVIYCICCILLCAFGLQRKEQRLSEALQKEGGRGA